MLKLSATVMTAVERIL